MKRTNVSLLRDLGKIDFLIGKGKVTGDVQILMIGAYYARRLLYR